MKRRTRVFMIAAAVIVLMGVMLCVAGAAVGAAGDEQIFPGSTEEGRCYQYHFGDTDIGRVSIECVKADINIIGSSDKSRIEVINFNENLCTFTNSNAMVTFKETPDVSSALKFWESGFTFKGLRYLFCPGGDETGGMINIYLAQDVKINTFDIYTASGKISVSGLDTSTDYNLTVGTGNISVKDVSTDSTVMICAKDVSASTVSVDNLKAASVNVTAQIADVKTTALQAHTCDVSVRTGSADVQYIPPEEEKYTIEVESKGKLTIDGNEDCLDYFRYDPDENKVRKSDTEEKASVKIKGTDLSVHLDTPVRGLETEEEAETAAAG